MNIHEKIRTLREINHLTQEDMAEKLEMSKNGYAKLERGESKIKLEQIERLAMAFDVDVVELINNKKGFVYWVGIEQNQGDHTNFNYNVSDNDLSHQVEKLNLIIEHKDALLAQKENEIQILRDLIEALKKA